MSARPYNLDLDWKAPPEMRPFALRGVRGALWQLTHPMLYIATLDKVAVERTVPEGFVFDGASIPWLFQWVIPQHQSTWAPALFHDWAYGSRGAYGEFSRADADALFGNGLSKQRIPARRILAMYAVVDLFGQAAWDDTSPVDAYNRTQGLLAR